MLPLDKLAAFVAVARLENVSRAARALHISQSPLSRQIRAFEDAVGVALFTRARKRLQLTPAGRALLADASDLLDAAAGVERRARAVARGARHLTIGYVAGAVYCGGLARDLARLRRRAPATTVELRAMRSADQVRALALGAIDVGYAYAPAGDGTLVAREPFLLAAPRDQPGRARELLQALPLITLPEATAARARRSCSARAHGSGRSPASASRRPIPRSCSRSSAPGSGSAWCRRGSAPTRPARCALSRSRRPSPST